MTLFERLCDEHNALNRQQLSSLSNDQLYELSADELRRIPNNAFVRLVQSRFGAAGFERLLRPHQVDIFNAIISRFRDVFIDETNKNKFAVGKAQPAFGKTFICAVAMLTTLYLVAIQDSQVKRRSMHVLFVSLSTIINVQIIDQLRVILEQKKTAAAEVHNRQFVPQNLVDEFMRRVCRTNVKHTKSQLINALIVVSTPQWISHKLDNDRRLLPKTNHFCFCVLDECDHTIVGDQYFRVPLYFDTSFRMAISATPKRYIDAHIARGIPLGAPIFNQTYVDVPLAHRKKRNLIVATKIGTDPVTGDPITALNREHARYVKQSAAEMSARLLSALPAIEYIMASECLQDTPDAATKRANKPPVAYVALPSGVTETDGDNEGDSFGNDRQRKLEIRTQNHAALLAVASLVSKNCRLVVASKALKGSLSFALPPGVEVIFIEDAAELERLLAEVRPIDEWQTQEEYDLTTDRQVLASLEAQLKTLVVAIKSLSAQREALVEQFFADADPLAMLADAATLRLEKLATKTRVDEISAMIRPKKLAAQELQAQIRQCTPRARNHHELRAALTRQGGAFDFTRLCKKDRFTVVLDIRTLLRGVNFAQFTFIIPMLSLSSAEQYEQLIGRGMRLWHTWMAYIIEFDFNLCEGGNAANIVALIRGCPEMRASALAHIEQIGDEPLRERFVKLLNAPPPPPTTPEEPNATDPLPSSEQAAHQRRQRDALSPSRYNESGNVEDDEDVIADNDEDYTAGDEDDEDDDDDDEDDEDDEDDDDKDDEESSDSGEGTRDEDLSDVIDSDNDDYTPGSNAPRSRVGQKRKRNGAQRASSARSDNRSRTRTMPLKVVNDDTTFYKFAEEEVDQRVFVDKSHMASMIAASTNLLRVQASHHNVALDDHLALRANIHVWSQDMQKLVPQALNDDAFQRQFGHKHRFTEQECDLFCRIIARFAPVGAGKISRAYAGGDLYEFACTEEKNLLHSVLLARYGNVERGHAFRNFEALWRAAGNLVPRFSIAVVETAQGKGAFGTLIADDGDDDEEQLAYDDDDFFKGLRETGVKVVAFKSGKRTAEGDLSLRDPYLYRFLSIQHRAIPPRSAALLHQQLQYGSDDDVDDKQQNNAEEDKDAEEEDKDYNPNDPEEKHALHLDQRY